MFKIMPCSIRRFTLATGLLVGCFFKGNSSLLLNTSEAERPESQQKIITIDVLKSKLSRGNWHLLHNPCKSRDIAIAGWDGKNNDAQLRFDWAVLRDSNSKVFRENGRFYFACSSDNTLHKQRNFTAKDGELVTFEVWDKPLEISTAGSFTMSGEVSVKENEEVLVVLLQELLFETRDGRVIKTWFTSRVTTVEFVRKKATK